MQATPTKPVYALGEGECILAAFGDFGEHTATTFAARTGGECRQRALGRARAREEALSRPGADDRSQGRRSQFGQGLRAEALARLDRLASYLPYVAVKLALPSNALPMPLFSTKPYSPAVPVFGTPPATSSLSTATANSVKM